MTIMQRITKHQSSQPVGLKLSGILIEMAVTDSLRALLHQTPTLKLFKSDAADVIDPVLKILQRLKVTLNIASVGGEDIDTRSNRPMLGNAPRYCSQSVYKPRTVAMVVSWPNLLPIRPSRAGAKNRREYTDQRKFFVNSSVS